jgi:type IV pilus assembly protein PilE
MKTNLGFTLVEIMIVVAILAIIAAIAIPAYNGYIREAKLGTAKANMETLRIFLEDTKLEDGSYVPGGGSGPATYANTGAVETAYNWSPDGDQDKYSYSVTASSNSYDIVVQHTSGVWIRCEDRMTTCCDSTGSGTTSACPSS